MAVCVRQSLECHSAAWIELDGAETRGRAFLWPPRIGERMSRP